jgi:cation:H+ antiporter
MLISIAYIIGALAALFLGANWLVKGAASLAERFGVSTLVVGLTVVAYGTSTPEMIVSAQAAVNGLGGISIGNVLGSNIVNIGIILGLSALIFPLRANMQLIKFDTPVMILVAGLFMVLFLDNRIGRIEGSIFLLLLVAYTLFNVIKSRKETKKMVLEEFDEGMPKITRHWGFDILWIGLGLAALMVGSNFLVKGAVDLARMLGMSETVIGLTIVALGTSMPELATSVVAAFKKQPDIAIGNVVGSNIFNIIGILGITSLIQPIEAPDINLVDLLVMLGMSILLLPLIKTGFTLRRWEGALFVAIYIGYVVYLLY